MNNKTVIIRRILMVSTALTILSPSFAFAQSAAGPLLGTEPNSPPPPPPPPLVTTSSMSQVIVTGTTRKGRTALKSLTPVAVISGKTLQKTGQVNLRNALVALSPAIGKQSMGYDAAALKSVLTLDELTPNDVIVLVNGLPRHETADITLDSGLQQGSSGVDLSMIPVSAISSVEILSNGASAEYGSGAIAGVINIILKSADHGGSISTTEGQYYDGEGFTRDLAGNVGLSLGQNGFLNLSFQYAGSNHTNDMGIDPRTGGYSNKIQGNPASNREIVGFNAGYYLDNGIKFYGFGTYGHRDASAYENFRLGSVLPEVFPGGFNPQETINENDFSLTAGIKGPSLLGWHWNLSSTYGGNYDNIGLSHSVNNSLFLATGYTPHAFSIDNLTNVELNNNLGFTRSLRTPLFPSPLIVKFGFEQTTQHYTIGPGDPASYYGSGAQSEDGLSPIDAGAYARHAVGAYVDLATNITPQWRVNLAGRYEKYSDAGETKIGELSTRYVINKKLALRASVGTAFQAPTLAEEHFTDLNVGPTTANGLLAASSPVAQALGAKALQPENSKNVDFGLVLTPNAVSSITIDAYQININNDIVEGGQVTGSTAIAALAAANFGLQPGLDPAAVTVNYFTNGANIGVRGINLTGHYDQSLGKNGTITWSVASNIEDVEATKIRVLNGAPELNIAQVQDLTGASPKYKIVFGGDWEKGKWAVNALETLWGPVHQDLTYQTGVNAYSSSVFYEFTEPLKFTTNLALTYKLTKKLSLTLGANNLFDVRPRKVPLSTSYAGSQYAASVEQLGFNGGFYYLNAGYDF